MPNVPKSAKLTKSSVDILNAIRNSATANYQDYIPAASDSLDSIREIGAIIMDYPALQNEFLHALVNRIGRVMITSKMFTNPWAMFKKGLLEFGETIEDIFVNIAKPFSYDPAVAESKVFAREIPDVRAAFHILNYQKFYKATIQNEQLRQAFLSWDGITELIAKIVDAMYTGANYDEFQVMKYMLARHILNGELKAIDVSAGYTGSAITNAKAIVSKIKKVSNDITFPKTDYNITGVTTFTPKDSQYIILNSEFDSTMDVEVLAAAFNMDKADFMGHRVLVDGFGELDTDRLEELFGDSDSYTPLTDDEIAALNSVPAVLLDKDYFMIFDNLYNFTEQYNGEGLYWNYWYHVWKTFSVSPFANAAMFVPGTPNVEANGVTISPVGTELAPVVVTKGQQLKLSAEVETEYGASKVVLWSVDDDAADDGITVDIYGTVTIPDDATVEGFTVTATSKAKPTISDECVVVIGIPTVEDDNP